MSYLPRLVGGGLLLLAAWIVATVVRKVMRLCFRPLSSMRRRETGEGGKPIALSRTFAEIVYWLIFLLFPSRHFAGIGNAVVA